MFVAASRPSMRSRCASSIFSYSVCCCFMRASCSSFHLPCITSTCRRSRHPYAVPAATCSITRKRLCTSDIVSTWHDCMYLQAIGQLLQIKTRHKPWPNPKQRISGQAGAPAPRGSPCDRRRCPSAGGSPRSARAPASARSPSWLQTPRACPACPSASPPPPARTQHNACHLLLNLTRSGPRALSESVSLSAHCTDARATRLT